RQGRRGLLEAAARRRRPPDVRAHARLISTDFCLVVALCPADHDSLAVIDANGGIAAPLHPVVDGLGPAGTLVAMSSTDVSAKLFADACALIPGGVNSPVRAFSAVGGTPRFITSAQGYWLTDADDNRYIDLVCSWGPMILGHAHPAVVDAVQRAAAGGLSFGAPTPSETELASEIIERVDAVDRLRLVNSGTEATMSAIRLARGYTGRAKIIKFSGC